MNTKSFYTLSRVLFFLGVILGFARSVIAIWDNLESTDYYFRGVTYVAFNGLKCPLMIAPTEKGIVTATFKNPTSDEDTFYYRAEISGKAFSTRQIEDHIAVPPHQTKKFQFNVDANDVDLLFFILVKLTIFPNSVHSSQEATCGTIVANLLGLTGSQVSMAALVLSIFGIIVGLVLWRQTTTRVIGGIPPVIQALGIVVLLTLFATYMGWWTVATVLAVIIILLVLISLRFAFA